MPTWCSPVAMYIEKHATTLLSLALATTGVFFIVVMERAWEDPGLLWCTETYCKEPPGFDRLYLGTMYVLYPVCTIFAIIILWAPGHWMFSPLRRKTTAMLLIFLLIASCIQLVASTITWRHHVYPLHVLQPYNVTVTPMDAATCVVRFTGAIAGLLPADQSMIIQVKGVADNVVAPDHVSPTSTPLFEELVRSGARSGAYEERTIAGLVTGTKYIFLFAPADSNDKVDYFPYIWLEDRKAYLDPRAYMFCRWEGGDHPTCS